MDEGQAEPTSAELHERDQLLVMLELLARDLKQLHREREEARAWARRLWHVVEHGPGGPPPFDDDVPQWLREPQPSND